VNTPSNVPVGPVLPIGPVGPVDPEPPNPVCEFITTSSAPLIPNKVNVDVAMVEPLTVIASTKGWRIAGFSILVILLQTLQVEIILQKY
jgi:hypothetical protein